MSTTSVRVFPTEEGLWAVQSDATDSHHVTYPSRGAAIAAGVHMALADDAILMIHGIDDTLSELDFRDGVSTAAL
ncbi:DUF2188 domain-containing protein [Cupriavidus sp. BIC8F]|uniref:DUF2188 domain-containing protein n=1 Tax=Cupriavidus sp. BIC8F TaxID=3079014 RepID=UPI00291621EF|nr:DUF2188 domain-containing protein [Cupriavidus sp. BIC8F]